jgi:hypothetical protein
LGLIDPDAIDITEEIVPGFCRRIRAGGIESPGPILRLGWFLVSGSDKRGKGRKAAEIDGGDKRESTK